jgi:hypothetical protein
LDSTIGLLALVVLVFVVLLAGVKFMGEGVAGLQVILKSPPPTPLSIQIN